MKPRSHIFIELGGHVLEDGPSVYSMEVDHLTAYVERDDDDLFEEDADCFGPSEEEDDDWNLGF